MHVIKLAPLRDFWALHPDAERPLRHWWEVARRASWRTILDVRRVFPQADALEIDGRIATIFNIGGNKYRLNVVIHYNRQKIYIRRVMTHAEYSTEKWKESL